MKKIFSKFSTKSPKDSGNISRNHQKNISNQKKKLRTPIKVAVATLLVGVVAVNLIHSSYQNVQAKGMFKNVESKYKTENGEIKTTDIKNFKILEILPEEQSVSIMKMLIGQDPFDNMLSNMSNSDIEALAKRLHALGLLSMDSSDATNYPMTFYKATEKGTDFINNVNEIPEGRNGYALKKTEDGEDGVLTSGTFQKVTKGKAHYKGVVVATPTPIEDTPSTPQQASLKKMEKTSVYVGTAATEEQVNESAENVTGDEESAEPGKEVQITEPAAEEVENTKDVTEADVQEDGAPQEGEPEEGKTEDGEEEPTPTPTTEPTKEPTLTPTQEATATPTPTPMVAPVDQPYVEIEGRYIKLTYIPEGETVDENNVYEYFEFYPDCPEDCEDMENPQRDNGLEGQGWMYRFEAHAEIKSNHLFQKAVLGLTNEEIANDLLKDIVTVNSISVRDVATVTMTDYDLVYIANPVMYRANSEGEENNEILQFYEYAKAEPSDNGLLSISPWVLNAYRENTDKETEHMTAYVFDLMNQVLDSQNPAKLMIDSSILEAFGSFMDIVGVVDTGEGTNSAAMAAKYLENATSDPVLKMLYILAQDDYKTAAEQVGEFTSTSDSTSTFAVDQAKWNGYTITGDEVKDTVSTGTGKFATTKGQYVNDALYFFSYHQEKYKKSVMAKRSKDEMDGDPATFNLANGDFTAAMTKDVLKAGFAQVLEAIELENQRNAALENNRPKIEDTEIGSDIVIQYLLNYTGDSVEIKKNKISVLEIEPGPDFALKGLGTEKKMTIKVPENWKELPKYYSYTQSGSDKESEKIEITGYSTSGGWHSSSCEVPINVNKITVYSSGTSKGSKSVSGVSDFTVKVGSDYALSVDCSSLDSSLTFATDKDGNKISTPNGYLTTRQKEFIDKYMKYFADNDRYSDVVFTSQSMQEFIGKNENLNDNYDLICIGSRIGCFYSDKSGDATKITDLENGNRLFNDPSMKGLVYSHIGDKTYINGDAYSTYGLLARDYTSDDRTKGLEVKKYGTTQMRTSGNDLTSYKKRDLINFLESGYPVLVANNLFNISDGAPQSINAKDQGVSSSRNTRKLTLEVNGSWTALPKYYAVSVDGKTFEGRLETTNWSRNSKNNHVSSYTIPINVKYVKIYAKEGTDKGNVDISTVQENQNVNIYINNGYTYSKTYPEAASDSGSGQTVTVDSSTYLYQVLKLASSAKGTYQPEEVKKKGYYNYDMNISGKTSADIFNWENRQYPNLLIDDTVEAQQKLATYLNTTRIDLNLTELPTEYNYTEYADAEHPGRSIQSVQYLEKDADGRYYLRYEFSISTLEGAVLSDKTFDCNLYIDQNFDGKFSENSEYLSKSSMVIKNHGTGQVETCGENSKYSLAEGNIYTLSYKLPKSFDGCINWKLQVRSNQFTSILAEKTGYCAINVTPKTASGTEDKTKDKQEIRILQITSGSTTVEQEKRTSMEGTYINMEKALNGEGLYGKLNWNDLLANIPDFELKIKTRSGNEVAKELVGKSDADIKNYFLNYKIENEPIDMVVVGFIDAYSLNGKDVTGDDDTGFKGEAAFVEALNAFGESGKSILFTHDTTSWSGDYKKQSSYVDENSSDYDKTTAKSSQFMTIGIRGLCGMDQFGLTTKLFGNKVSSFASSDDNAKTYIDQYFKTPDGNEKLVAKGNDYEKSKVTGDEWKSIVDSIAGLSTHDVAFKPNTNQEAVSGDTQGNTYGGVRIKNMGASAVAYMKGLDNGKKYEWFSDSHLDMKVEIGKINDGAITDYPYKLPESFDVACTHAQYWTVDLEADDNNDDESDLVVWYTLNSTDGYDGAEGLYEASPNDVRNNYYIYNKGNITYSGAGHYVISSDTEIKLFINTMIAAYNAQLKLPEVSFVDNAEYDAEEIENITIPYDAALTTEVASQIDPMADNIAYTADGNSGTVKAYFNVYDGNLTARNKRIVIDELFQTYDTGANTTTIGGTEEKGKSYKSSTDLQIYNAKTDAKVEYNALENGQTYYVILPVSEAFKTQQYTRLYVQMHTEIGDGSAVQKTATVHDALDISRAQLFELD